ncbi:xanthine dehydrogenase family protein subunit M [Sporosarcina sp. 6E9]|uniref:FAD binding domain-containing protein n=1 Tax=Sporosarcina sp. 6E9 TaxID=2819235 RepID=UPI001B31822A|nr:FAD binding domain-containing protein [Sporosarcina sp. 6E9]
MIAFDFAYYKPETILEAFETYATENDQGKKVVYYAGGTEFITFARVNKLDANVVIDIKGISECNVLEIKDGQLIIGSAVSLNKISDSNLFPLLGQTAKKIADHTSRNKISIGGNMNSRLMYRECLLPLLVVEANVVIFSKNETKIVPVAHLYNGTVKLTAGDFLVQIIINTSMIDLPYVSFKRTKLSKVGYPVLSLAAIRTDSEKIRVAFSGICENPFRSKKIEKIINDTALTIDERVEQVATSLPIPVISDIESSMEYRVFVLKNALSDMIAELELAK